MPLLIVLGHWPERIASMRKQLVDAVGASRASEVMRVVDTFVQQKTPVPVEGEAVYEAFLLHAELGVAYLAVFPHRHEHYAAHFGHRWTRKSIGVRLDHVAHAESRVCMSNPSGLTAAPLAASTHGMQFWILVWARGHTCQHTTGRAGGFELNANPLLLQQVLTIIGGTAPTSASSRCRSRRRGACCHDVSYVLFSWRPGSHRCQ